MKKNFFYAGMLAMAMLTVTTSCSKDDVLADAPGNNTEVAAGEQVIVLDVQNTDILSTKSRPLYSAENQGAEKVTDVKILIFKEDKNGQQKFVRTESISSWNSVSSDYNFGRQYTLKLTDKLDVGKYTFLAVGQDESTETGSGAFSILAPGLSASKISTNWSSITNNALWEPDHTINNGFLNTEAVNGADNAQEIFSGTSEPVLVNITDDQAAAGFTANILLKRQVAGVIGYFNKIPAFVQVDDSKKAVKKIRLVASNRNTKLNLTHRLFVQRDDNTHSSVSDQYLENVVNGFTSDETNDAWYKASSAEGGATPTTKDAYIVYEIDLTDWFVPAKADASSADDETFWFGASHSLNFDSGIPTLGDETALATGEKVTWKNKYSSVNVGVPTVAGNSVLAGKFVIPFDRVNDKNTFELQLIGSNVGDDIVLKSWNVSLAAVDTEKTPEDTKYIHSIYRNQLYQIGQRGAGDNPNNPGEGGDKPQPLDKDQELTIRINDSWEIIHDMEIE